MLSFTRQNGDRPDEVDFAQSLSCGLLHGRKCPDLNREVLSTQFVVNRFKVPARITVRRRDDRKVVDVKELTEAEGDPQPANFLREQFGSFALSTRLCLCRFDADRSSERQA